MAKEIVAGASARKVAGAALSEIAGIVGETLGPSGRPILLSRQTAATSTSVIHTKDGITVLRELSFVEPIKDAVHKMAIQAAADTVIASGDGPQPLWAKVLTPAGFVDMKDVTVGMEICGTNGTKQTVLGVFPKGEKEIYEVEFPNGRIVECCEDHLWTIMDTRGNPKLKTKTTKELEKDYCKINAGYPHFRYYTPRTVVEFMNVESEMPLDPYLVGLLLGDGSLSGTGSVELSLGEKKKHVIDKIKLPEGFSLTVTFVSNKNAYRVKIKGKDCQGRSIHAIIETMGLLGTKSDSKFIPKAYLYSSEASRRKLLQGLMDTDGHVVAGRQNAFEFSSVSPALAEGFTELCRSLGKTAAMRLKERKVGGGSYSTRPIYCVSVSVGRKYGNAIRRITATGKKTEMQCIKVSNPDNLYITDNYIVTHNTTSTLVMADAFARVLSSDGSNPQAAARKCRKEVDAAVAAIAAEAASSDTAEYKVALTSTNHDEELTAVVMDALKNTSAYGTVLVEKNPMSQDRYKVDKDFGYKAGSGYSYNVTHAISVSDNAVTNGEFNIPNAYVIPYNGNVNQITQIKTILEKLYKHTRGNFNALFVAYDFSEDVINQVIMTNRSNPGAKIFLTKTVPTAELNGPWNQLNDISAFSGSQVVDGGTANFWEVSQAGIVQSVRVGPYSTFILGRGEKNRIAARAEENMDSARKAPSPLDKDIILSRNASLTGGLVKLIIGSGLPGDLQEIADRADDAIKAVQACRRSGALPGAGASYIRAGILAKVSEPVAKALSSINRKILENHGSSASEYNIGMDKGCTIRIGTSEPVYGDFLEIGVADSFETVKSVIINGFTLGSLISNLGGYCIHSDIEEIQKAMLLKNVIGV